jgi:hypothetical protein
MSSRRWQEETEIDNAGKDLPTWTWGDYKLQQNVNQGKEGGWMFELTLKDERVSLHAKLSEGKTAAEERERARIEPAEGRTGAS